MRDRIGNEFKPGQWVQVSIAPPYTLLAQVQAVQDGTLMIADGVIAPGQLILVAVLPMQVQPNVNVEGVVVLQQPPDPPKVSN